MAVSPFIADLVFANRILYDQGILDGFGHVSVRSDQSADRYFLARAIAPSLVQPEDILEYDLDSLPTTAAHSYLERFIHGEIYRERPDVMSVVHSHSPNLIPFGVSSVPLRAVCHMGGFLRDVKKFDIRIATGQMTDMLIRSQDLGRSLAMSLEKSSIILMRGHGTTAVGASLKEATFRAIYAELNAVLQMRAMSLGEPVQYLSSEEAELAEIANASQYDRPWELWKRQSCGRHVLSETSNLRRSIHLAKRAASKDSTALGALRRQFRWFSH